MPILNSRDAEKDGLLQASKLMLLSVRTAPKSGGVDDILAAIVSGPEKELLAKEMDKIAEERNISGFKRDADNVRNSENVVLIGVRGTIKFGFDCGSCGYLNCEEFERAEKKLGRDFIGPNCVFKVLDLGIALGSAVKTASLHNVDNRIMYRIGVAAKRMKMLSEASVIMGIPVSAKGKSIYFDRSG
jgi:uncharacterized ferredoxin-like protein